MAVSVVVSSPEAVTLHVSQQRFTMSVDPLTLRLFHKVSPLVSEASMPHTRLH